MTWSRSNIIYDIGGHETHIIYGPLTFAWIPWLYTTVSFCVCQKAFCCAETGHFIHNFSSMCDQNLRDSGSNVARAKATFFCALFPLEQCANTCACTTTLLCLLNYQRAIYFTPFHSLLLFFCSSQVSLLQHNFTAIAAIWHHFFNKSLYYSAKKKWLWLFFSRTGSSRKTLLDVFKIWRTFLLLIKPKTFNVINVASIIGATILIQRSRNEVGVVFLACTSISAMATLKFWSTSNLCTVLRPK